MTSTGGGGTICATCNQCRTSQPETGCIIRSSTISWGQNSRTNCMASCPLLTPRTSKPEYCKNRQSTRNISASSSTTKMRVLLSASNMYITSTRPRRPVTTGLLNIILIEWNICIYEYQSSERDRVTRV